MIHMGYRWKKWVEATEARVMSSACRGYVVMLDPNSADRARLIKDQHGATEHFVSLAQVRNALRRINVNKVAFAEHYVCEELGTHRESVLGIG
jgi:hypothetical protein